MVLDTFSRLVAGWSIDSTQTTALVLNALGMATQRRQHRDGLIVPLRSRDANSRPWAFSNRLRGSGIAPSMGAVGAAGRQRDDGELLGSPASRGAQPPALKDPHQTRISDPRLHPVPQHPAPSLGARYAHAVRDQDRLDRRQQLCCHPPGSCSDRLEGGGRSRRPCWSRCDLRSRQPARPSTSPSQQRPSRLTSHRRLHRNQGRSPCPPKRGELQSRTLNRVGDTEGEHAVNEVLIADFGHGPPLGSVAGAMYNEGIYLRDAGRGDEAVALRDELWTRFSKEWPDSAGFLPILGQLRQEHLPGPSRPA